MSQVHTVEVVTPGPSNTVRAHKHPILETGNLSFPSGKYYLDFKSNIEQESYVIHHRIEGAALVERLLKENKAQFACVVSSPISSYREIHLAIEAEHEVSWKTDELGDAPFITPMVLCMESLELIIDADRDDIHQIWHGQQINLQKGSRLVLGDVVQFQSSILQLISLNEDADLEEGQFVVEIKEEPFHFYIKVSPVLHKFLRYRTDLIRKSIMTHIVTACFARLQNDYDHDDGESGWRSFQQLRVLAEFLEHNGIEHWCDNDFRPEKAATALYPHELPNINLEWGNGT